MGFVRKHPLATIVFVVLLSPALAFGVVAALQYLPECTERRAQVEAQTDARMRNRYLGDGVGQEFDRAYAHWETTFQETRRAVRAQVSHELSKSRPDLCF